MSIPPVKVIRDKKGRFVKGNHASHRTEFKKGQKLSDSIKKKLRAARKARVGKLSPNYKGKIFHRGYVLVFSPSHPFSTKKHYVYEHRLVMERHLGRYLTKSEVIHHINRNKKDNKINNLMLFPNNQAHLRFHRELKKNGK